MNYVDLYGKAYGAVISARSYFADLAKNFTQTRHGQWKSEIYQEKAANLGDTLFVLRSQRAELDCLENAAIFLENEALHHHTPNMVCFTRNDWERYQLMRGVDQADDIE